MFLKSSYYVYMVNTKRQYVTVSVLLMIGAGFLVAGTLYEPPTNQVEYVSENGTDEFADPAPQTSNETGMREMNPSQENQAATSVEVFAYDNLTKGKQAVIDQAVDNQSQIVRTTYQFPDEFVVAQGDTNYAIQQPGISEFRVFGLVVGVGFVALALIAGLTGRSTVEYTQLAKSEDGRWTFDIENSDDRDDD